MILSIYCFRDTKIGEYCTPFYVQNDEVAKRVSKISLNDERSEFSKYPEDIELYRLGKFETKSGAIVPDIQFIANGIELKDGDI